MRVDYPETGRARFRMGTTFPTTMNFAGELFAVEVGVRNGSFDVGQVKRLLGDIRLARPATVP